jgi:hypothetical protein
MWWLHRLQHAVASHGGLLQLALGVTRVLDWSADHGAVEDHACIQAAASCLGHLAELTFKAPGLAGDSGVEVAALVLRCWVGRHMSLHKSHDATKKLKVVEQLPAAFTPFWSASAAVTAAASTLARAGGDTWEVLLNIVLQSADASAAGDGNALGDFDVVDWLVETHKLALSSISSSLQGAHNSHLLLQASIQLMTWTTDHLRRQGRAGTAGKLWITWIDFSLGQLVHSPQVASSAALHSYLAAQGSSILDSSFGINPNGKLQLPGFANFCEGGPPDSNGFVAGVPATVSNSAAEQTIGCSRSAIDEVLLVQQRLAESGTISSAALIERQNVSSSWELWRHLLRVNHSNSEAAVRRAAAARHLVSAPQRLPTKAAKPDRNEQGKSTRAYVRAWNRLQGIDSDSDSEGGGDEAIAAMDSMSAKQMRLSQWSEVQGAVESRWRQLQVLVDVPSAASNASLVMALVPSSLEKPELLLLLHHVLHLKWEPWLTTMQHAQLMLTPSQLLQCCCLLLILTNAAASARATVVEVAANLLASSADAVSLGTFKSISQDSLAATPVAHQLPVWRAYLRGMWSLLSSEATGQGRGRRCGSQPPPGKHDLRKWWLAAKKVAAAAQASTSAEISDTVLYIIADAFAALLGYSHGSLVRLDSKAYTATPAAGCILVTLALPAPPSALFRAWQAEAAQWKTGKISVLERLDSSRAQACAIAAAAACVAVHKLAHTSIVKLCGPILDSAESSWLKCLERMQTMAAVSNESLLPVITSCLRAASLLAFHGRCLQTSMTSHLIKCHALLPECSYLLKQACAIAIHSIVASHEDGALSERVGSRHQIMREISSAQCADSPLAARLVLQLLVGDECTPSSWLAKPGCHGALRSSSSRRLVKAACQHTSMMPSLSKARTLLVNMVMATPFDLLSWAMVPILAAAAGNANAADVHAFVEQAVKVGFPAVLLETV